MYVLEKWKRKKRTNTTLVCEDYLNDWNSRRN